MGKFSNLASCCVSLSVLSLNMVAVSVSGNALVKLGIIELPAKSPGLGDLVLTKLSIIDFILVITPAI